MQPDHVLQQYFGYPAFRPGQKPIVQALLNGQDVLALLPTGGGKSLCFQIPALCLPGTALVISPLISLMIDQVQALQKKGISAAYLSAQQSRLEQTQILAAAQLGTYKLIYLAPERLTTTGVEELLTHISISLLVIDEAHCISEWGHDFRPAYRQLSRFIGRLKTRPPIGAFTATATRDTQEDIRTVLQLEKPTTFISSFGRHNLYLNSLQCHSSTHKVIALGRILKQHAHQPALIYCATRTATEQLRDFLRATIYELRPDQVQAFHAGLDADHKKHIQDSYVVGQVELIIATTAFGMGIDKPDIRVVIHYHHSSSIENYYQEIGRAGRDGQSAWCYLLFSPLDIELHQAGSQLAKSQSKQLDRKHRKLRSICSLANSTKCRTQQILEYFGETVLTRCNHCDRCGESSLTSDRAELETKQRLTRYLAKARRFQPVWWQDIISQRLITLISVFQPQTAQAFQSLPGWGDALLRLQPSLLHDFSQCYRSSIGQAAHNP